MAPGTIGLRLSPDTFAIAAAGRCHREENQEHPENDFSRFAPGLPPGKAFQYRHRMLKLIAYRLLTSGIPVLFGLVVVTCHLSGLQQGLHDLPYMVAGVLVADIAIALLFDWRKARRLRRP